MIFPIGDQNVEGGYRPYVTYTLLTLNILVFIWQINMPPGQFEQFIDQFGAIPVEILSGNRIYTLFTSVFLHAGPAHLIGNMLFLWVFGDNIEAVAGHGKFLLYYITGGVVAGLAHLAFNLTSPIPAIGASGAISAILGTYLIFFPRSQIRVLILFFFRSVYIPALFFLGIWILMQLYSGVGSLSAAGGATGVAWWAHIGGFFFGVMYGLWNKKQMVYAVSVPEKDSLV